MTGCVAHLAAFGRRDAPPGRGGAHLLIIRIPKATTEIRREKGIDAYGGATDTEPS